MKKIIKWFLIVLLVAIIIDLIYVCYFAINVSATLPPIKMYKYIGNTTRLITGLKSYSISDSRFKLTSIDTTGGKDSGFSYEIIIDITQDHEKLRYDLKCEDLNSTTQSVDIALIGAHDLTNDKGGYGLKAQGMNRLIKLFDKDVIIPLKNKFGIEINSQ